VEKAKPTFPEEDEQVTIENTLRTNSEGTFRSRDLLEKIHDKGEVFDTLGQPSKKYDDYVKYSPASSFFDNPKDIVLDRWEGMDDPMPQEEGIVVMITPVVIELPDEDRTSDVEMKTTEPTMIDLMVEELSAIEILMENVTSRKKEDWRASQWTIATHPWNSCSHSDSHQGFSLKFPRAGETVIEAYSRSLFRYLCR